MNGYARTVGEQARVPVRIAGGEHGDNSVFFRRIGPAIAHRLPCAQRVHLCYDRNQPHDRLQASIHTTAVWIHAVKRDALTHHVQPGGGIVEYSAAVGGMAQRECNTGLLQPLQ